MSRFTTDATAGIRTPGISFTAMLASCSAVPLGIIAVKPLPAIPANGLSAWANSAAELYRFSGVFSSARWRTLPRPLGRGAATPSLP